MSTDTKKGIPGWQSRVLEERQDLIHRLDALLMVLGTKLHKSMPAEDQALLVRQAGAMQTYLDILNLRIAKW